MKITNLKHKLLIALVVVAVVAVTVLIATGVLHGLLVTLFIWPGGIVVGNLIASAMWQPQWFFSVHHKINHKHNVAMAKADMHHEEHMALAKQHHEELKTHITDAVNGGS